jgi:AcrR family transcriptional regulator
VNSRSVPVQRRSRERVERILQCAVQLLAEGGVDALTTRSLAEHTGIPVASIYRYFDNRDAVIAAYLDRELEAIEVAQSEALLALDRVTFRSLTEASALAHMRHHQQHPEGVPVWFGGRMNAAVVERVRALDARLAAAFRAAVRSSGMLEGVPDYFAGLLVRLFDRMFEYVFLAERTAAEQEAIVRSYVDMICTYMERFATPAGLEGISAEEFVAAFEKGSREAPARSTAPPRARAQGAPKRGRVGASVKQPRGARPPQRRSAQAGSRAARKRT